MGAVLALLPSPLLGPATWQPVKNRLVARGWPVVTPAVAPVAPRLPDDVLRAYLAVLPSDRDLVLIAHSNAGMYVPALTTSRRVVGYVFVDAGLPVGAGRVPLAPPNVLDFLRGRADADGLLPPWSSWWDDESVTRLFPDAQVRGQVEREQHRLPLSYFVDSVSLPAGWDDRPGAYLAFGDTYVADREEAGRRGWPVVTLFGRHLHMLVDPRRVAAEMDTLLAMIGVRLRHT
ncbi:MAG: hypothetical protein QOI74_2400 [Micromonosporaceae bacterium]|nr:hypothetical protein [Micromonosporaceae bacterium]MDT5037110.1 hypothetical protein [Micromonosporaceae bacterium]